MTGHGRAERRRRTEVKRAHRNRLWRHLMERPPRNEGLARNRSPFDCGNPRCGLCGRALRPRVAAVLEIAEQLDAEPSGASQVRRGSG